jgi:hypothetical protein
MEYLGAWGTLFHEKNLKSKISCKTPFKVVKNKFYIFTGASSLHRKPTIRSKMNFKSIEQRI